MALSSTQWARPSAGLLINHQSWQEGQLRSLCKQKPTPEGQKPLLTTEEGGWLHQLGVDTPEEVPVTRTLRGDSLTRL